jgi:hypothetical protein
MPPPPPPPPPPPDPRDLVELSSSPTPGTGPSYAHTESPTAASPRSPSRFLSLYFACANAYGRAYKSPDGSCYQGRCPKCGKTISFPIGQGGTGRRMFEVRCD